MADTDVRDVIAKAMAEAAMRRKGWPEKELASGGWETAADWQGAAADAAAAIEDVAKLEELSAAASPGPMRAVDLRHQKGGQIRIFPAMGEGYIAANVLRTNPRALADAEFVVEAVNFVRDLIASRAALSVTEETRNA